MLQYGGENLARVRRCEASTLTKIHVKLLGKKKKNLQDDSQRGEFADFQLLCVVDP